tara:strand:- start:2492 stop:3073 length:582 start_codon:yes stop_codon:yes gene_type:complete
MVLKEHYWIFDQALTENICKEIIKLGKKNKSKLGVTHNTTSKQLKKIRNSNVKWLDQRWLYQTISPYIATANRNAGWNFEYSWFEPIQFTIYKKNQFYDWHQDAGRDVYKSKDLNWDNKIRKLSIIVSLTDPKKYTGGELEIELPGKKKKINTLKLKRGTIVVFPSFIWHRVKPVKSGERNSLVNWIIGKPWQ